MREGEGRTRARNAEQWQSRLRRVRDVYPTLMWPLFHFVQVLPSQIAIDFAVHSAAAQVVHKCLREKLGFYEVCEATLEQGTPGASIFNNVGK